MDNKELYEILQKYAEETRGDKDVDLKKLHEKQRTQEEIKSSKTKNRFKPQYVFVAAMCVIVIALSIALPITLTSNSQETVEPTFCWSEEIEYQMEDSISSIIDTYHINAYYPTCVIDTDDMLIGSISSMKDESLHGVKISYIIEDEGMIFIDFVIIPKTHILETYASYFSLQNKLTWTEYDVKFLNEYDEEIVMNDMQIYFTDGKYDYFIDVESDEEIGPAEILDILYN